MTGMTDNGLLDLLLEVSSCRHQPEGEPIFDLQYRRPLTRAFAWGIPNERALATIERVAGTEGVLEVGCGTGYWAALLRARGVDVTATDAAPPAPHLGSQHNPWHAESPTWTDVEQLDAVRAVEKYTSKTLLYVWPPTTSEMASESLGRYEGDVVVYVGEWPAGVTGTRRFHDMLSDGWDWELRVEIPVWSRRSDALHVFRRQRTPPRAL